MHQSDYIVGRFTGEYGVTDYSNALKSGFDMKEEVWPNLLDLLGLDRRIFPAVIPPGQVIGNVTKEIAEEFEFHRIQWWLPEQQTAMCLAISTGRSKEVIGHLS